MAKFTPILPTDIGTEWDEANSGGWLLSYIDLLTLLLAVTVIVLSQRHAVTQEPDTASPQGALRSTAGEPSVETAEALLTQASSKPSDLFSLAPLLSGATEMAWVERRYSAAKAAATEEKAMPNDRPRRLAAAVEQHFPGLVEAVHNEGDVSLAIADAVLFDSGRAELTEHSKPLLARLAGLLKKAGGTHVAVQGHTDDRPVRGDRFQSNWELSAARATAVTRYLIGQGLAPSRVRAVGFADTRPLADNATTKGRARNRRVNLVVEFDENSDAQEMASIGFRVHSTPP